MFDKKLINGADVVSTLPDCIKSRFHKFNRSDSSPASFGFVVSADYDIDAMATIIREASIIFLRRNHYLDAFLIDIKMHAKEVTITVRYARNKGDLRHLRNPGNKNEFDHIL